MRISYKTHPALRFFLQGRKECILNAGGKGFYETKDAAYLEHKIFNTISNHNGKVNIVSGLFLNALNAVRKGIGDFMQNQLFTASNECFKSEDLFIVGANVIFIKMTKSPGVQLVAEIFITTREGYVIGGMLFKQDPQSIFFISKALGEYELAKEQFITIANGCLMLSIFKQYAKVELHEVCRQKKERIPGEKEPIFNELDRAILHLNSSWWTEIMRDAAFSVRGHFRLQPKKDEAGEWTRELIWINTFVKTGYHRRSQKQIELESLSPE